MVTYNRVRATVTEKPIPAFYCCYLLKSTVQPRSALYIGSTPNPVRRLRQHNGLIKGGAWKTAKNNRGGSKRPWAMCLLVTGFPSRIAALQFEWAWQHAHITRHVAADSKNPVLLTRRGKAPALKLESGLKNLYRLIHARSFSRWPISIEVFDEQVHTKWLTCRDELDQELKIETKTECNFHPLAANSQPKHASNQSQEIIDPSADPYGVATLAVTHDPAKQHVEKSLNILQDGTVARCHVCDNSLQHDRSFAVVCPSQVCHAAFHLPCLSRTMLEQERNIIDVLPKRGTCPVCQTLLQWRDLIQDASLRLHGGDALTSLFRKRRRTKKDQSQEGLPDAELDESAEEESDEESDERSHLVIPPNSSQEFLDLPFEDELQGGDDFLDIDDISDLEQRPVRRSPKTKRKPASKKSAVVIDDSEASDRDT